MLVFFGTADVWAGFTFEHIEHDALQYFENVIGSSGSDTIYGNDAVNILSGREGADKLYGGAGNDELYGGADRDNLSGGAGNDILHGGDGIDTVDYSYLSSNKNVVIDLSQGFGRGYDFTTQSTIDTDTLVSIENATGSSGQDTIFGNAQDNILSGGAGRDFIFGGSGNDTLIGGSDDDYLDGNSGNDTVDYSYLSSNKSVVIDLSQGFGRGYDFTTQSTIDTDTLVSIENATGSSGQDTIFGNAQDNILSGGAGRDFIFGGSGNDTLIGGADDDRISGGLGSDSLNGGSGIDTIDYSYLTNGEDVTLNLGIASNVNIYDTTDTTLLETDFVSNFENAIGGSGNDVFFANHDGSELSGGAGDDTLVGSNNADILSGDTGNDILRGGGGVDVVKGGAGNDTIDYDATDSLIDGGSGHDTLVLRGSGGSLELATIAPGLLNGIEQIDLDDGTINFGGNELYLNAQEVLNLSNTSNLLIVEGNGYDKVYLAAEFSYTGTTTFNGMDYDQYIAGDAVVLINQLVNQHVDGSQHPTVTGFTIGIDENTDGVSSLGTVAASDDGTIVSYDITDGNNGQFSINASGEVFVTGALDKETVGQHTLTITVTDNDGLTDDAMVTVNVGDVNEAPTVSLQNMVANLSEDIDTTSAFKVADIIISDDALGTNNLSLSGADAALFEIVGSELFLKAETSLDFETNPSLDVTVEVDDTSIPGTPDSSINLPITVTGVNEAPTVSLQNTVANLAENFDTTSAFKVAYIIISDDALGTNNLSLSGADAALFEIVGSELFLKAGASLDFETNPSLDVTVEVDDASIPGTPDSSVNLPITVTDVNEAPTVGLQNTIASLAEDIDTTSGFKVADIIISDDALGTNNLSLSGTDAALFEIVGSELHLKAGASLDYETNPTLDLRIEVDDSAVGGTPDDSVDFTLEVTDVNETAPVFTPVALTDEYQVNTFTDGSQVHPSTTLLADGGHLVVWWSRDDINSPNLYYDIHAQRYDAAGNLVGDEFLVNDDTISSQQHSDVTALANGGFAITWHSQVGQDIYAKTYDVNGIPSGEGFIVNSEIASIWQDGTNKPVITALDAGGFIVVWEHKGLDNPYDPSTNPFDGAEGVFGQRYSDTGNAVGGQFQINSNVDYQQIESAVAGWSNDGADDGSFVVVWESNHLDYNDFNIYGQKFNADGSKSGGEFSVNTSTVGNQHYPQVTELAGGGFVVSWADRDDRSIYGQIYNPDGSENGTNFELSDSPSPGVYSTITGLSNGDFVVLWEDSWIRGQRFDSDGNLIGDEFRINDLTYSNENYMPEVTALEDGKFLVSWSIRVDDNFEIFSKVYGIGLDTPVPDTSLTAVASGDEFLVNTETTNQNQDDAEITKLADGGYVVTWTSASDGHNTGVYGQIYYADGTVNGGEFIINTTTNYGQADTSVAALGNGFVVTWDSQVAEGVALVPTILGQRFDDSGTKLGGEFEIPSHAGKQYDSSVTELANGDGFVVTWSSEGQEATDGNYQYGIYGQRYDIGGVKVGGEFHVNTETSSSQAFSDVASLAGGGFVVLWESSGQDILGEGIFGQQFDANGNSLVGGEFQVNTFEDGNQVDVSVTGLTDGGYVVTWGSAGYNLDDPDGSNFGVFGQLYDAFGTKVGTNFQINSYHYLNQMDPSVAALTDGGFVVSWTSESQDGYGTAIIGQQYDSEGNKVGNDFQVNTHAIDGQLMSNIAGLDNGDFVVTWESENQDGSGLGIYGQTFNATNVWLGTDNNDILTGDSGADVLNGKLGADVLTGGGGDDIFKLGGDAFGEALGGTPVIDTIMDYELLDDSVDLSGIFDAIEALNGGTGSVTDVNNVAGDLTVNYNDGSDHSVVVASMDIYTGVVSYTDDDNTQLMSGVI